MTPVLRTEKQQLGIIEGQCFLLAVPRWCSGERIHLPVREPHVRALGQEDPPEKEMETRSRVLAWKYS